MRPLADSTRMVFLLGLRLRESNPSDPSKLQESLLASLRTFEDSARKEGHSAKLVDEASFALSAWLDEIAFSCPSISLEWLGYSLAANRFHDPAAGTTFFDRMSALHQRSDMSDALDVYAQAILLGFQGKYRFEAPEALSNLARDVLDKRAGKSGYMVPWMPALDQDPGRLPKERTGRSLWWISLGFLIVGTSVYLLLAFLTGI